MKPSMSLPKKSPFFTNLQLANYLKGVLLYVLRNYTLAGIISFWLFRPSLFP